MALPTLDATFASSADLPRRQMLAKWLVQAIGSGNIADYYDLPERYIWAKIAVISGGPLGEADYISLPKNYAWSDIYNAVAGLIPPSNVLVSGLDNYVPSPTYFPNGKYEYVSDENGKPRYEKSIEEWISWSGGEWVIASAGGDPLFQSAEDVAYPWLVANWTPVDGTGTPVITESPAPSPNHTDWSENVALGHIVAAYRGDTGNPANLATYIDWPWRYKVAAIIDHLS